MEVDFSKLTPEDYERHALERFTPEEEKYCDDLIAKIPELAEYLIKRFTYQTYYVQHNLDVARAIVYLEDKSAFSLMSRLDKLRAGHPIAMAVMHSARDPDWLFKAHAWVDDANQIAYPSVNRAFALDRERNPR